MSFNIDTARNFISKASLPSAPPQVVAMGEEEKIFNTAKNQAAVVGQDVLAFTTGVEEDFREAISNSSLLAQLVASKRVADKQDIYAWYDAYFDVLRNIGWVVQDSGFSEYSESGDGFEVHERIIDVATVLLSPAPAALAIVKSTLDSLQKMDEDSPWIKIFSRESTKAKAARFQISLVRKDEQTSDLLVTMIAFGVEAEKTITQVLFFKVKKNRATLKSNSGQISINIESIKGLADDIRNKIRAYQKDYIAALPDL